MTWVIFSFNTPMRRWVVSAPTKASAYKLLCKHLAEEGNGNIPRGNDCNIVHIPAETVVEVWKEELCG